MVIVCACEGPLSEPRGDIVSCKWCSRSYPSREAVQVLKLLNLAARETDNDGRPANENVRRMALNKAAKRLAILKLKVFDETKWNPPSPPRRPQPPQPPSYTPSGVYTAATYTSNNVVDFGNGFGNVIFRVVVR